MTPRRVLIAIVAVATIVGSAFWFASTGGPAGARPTTADADHPKTEAPPSTGPGDSTAIVTSPFPAPSESGAKTDTRPVEESPLKKAIDDLVPAGLEFSVPAKGNSVLFGQWIRRADRLGHARDLRATRLGPKDELVARVIVTCDLEGCYRFEVKPGTYEVAFGATLHRIVLAAGEERRFDPVEPPGTVVFVRWLGKDLNLQGAQVISTSFDPSGAKTVARARTGADSTAELNDVPPGPARITGSTTTYPAGDPVRAAAEVSVPWSGTLEVVLRPPENSLVVEIVGEADGEPLSGVVAELKIDGRRMRKVSDRLGFLRFGSVPAGTFALQLADGIHVPVFENVVVDRAESRKRIAMTVGRSLLVRAKDQNGEPMRMILNGRRPGLDDPRPIWEARTDGDGLGEFKALPWREHPIEILVDTCDPLVVTFPAELPNRTPLELKFTKRVK